MCPGEQLLLTCHTNQSSALRWTITTPGGSDTLSQDVLDTGSIPQPLPLEIAGRTVTVHFTRQSANPFISTLSINSISRDLTGTRISCSTGDSSAITVVNVTEGNSSS